MQLVKYEQARQALAECQDLDEIKDISDKMTALKLYAKQKGDTDMEFWIAEIKIRAARRMGELTMELETTQGARNELVPQGGRSKAKILKDAGISTQEASRCERKLYTLCRSDISSAILTSLLVCLCFLAAICLRVTFASRR